MQARAKRKYRPRVDYAMPKKSASSKGSKEKPWPASKVSKAEQNYYHQEFKGFSFRMPSADETPKDARAEELCIFNEYYKVGFTLPLPPFLITFCNEGKILPGMLMPNTMAMLKGLHQFFVNWGIAWRMEHILSLLILTEKNGMFYGQPKHSSEFKMIGIPSSRHGWKRSYFFVKSKEPWPITPGIALPHIYSFRGWGNTIEIVALKQSYDNKPLCLHVETLAITTFDPKEAKKKKKGDGSPLAKKVKATAAGSEAEAETDDSDEEEETSIQWSVYEEESPVEQQPVEKPKKKTGKRAARQITQKKRVSRSTAASTVQAAGVGEAEAVPDVHTEAAPADFPVHRREIGGEQDIPSPMRRMFEEESRSRRPGKEPEGSKNPVECYYNETEDSFYIKRNTQFRCIPDIESSETPFHVSSIFLHPEDENKLKSTSLKDLSFLQAQMCMGATQISKFITEQQQQSEKDKKKLYRDNASITAFYEREKKTNNELRDRIKALEAQAVQDRANFEKTLTDKNKELQQFKADKDAAVKQLQEEEKESARKERINKNVIEGLKATAQRLSSHSGNIPKEDIIAEYKRSEEYGTLMKDFSEHGYILLKKYLERNQLLSKDQLSKIDFDDCIEEASDEESDNL